MPDQPWRGALKQSFTTEAFAAYCEALHWNDWTPQFAVIHHTEVPTLAQRPAGLTLEHMHALERFYRDERGWSGAPHLFVDDRQIWVFNALTEPGVHSPSWNDASLGIEMLGNYEEEPFEEGRGALVRDNTVQAIAALYSALGLTPSTLRLHCDDDQSHKTCPGKNVRKLDLIVRVAAAMSG